MIKKLAESSNNLYIDHNKDYIKRPQAEKILLSNNWKVLLLISPPGYGKTTFIRYINKINNLGFIYLKSESNEIYDFLAEIIKQLETVFSIKLDINLTKKISKKLIMSIIKVISTINKNIVLVLDDYHEIESKEINDCIYLFLKNSDNIRFLIISRTNPIFPFKDKMFIENKLLEIPVKHLILDTDQVKELLSFKKISLNNNDTKLIENYFEGWIGGICFFINHFNNLENFNLSSLKNITTSIYDYIENEIFNKLTFKEKNILSHLSLFDNFSYEMVDYLGHSDNFKKIVSKNLFIFEDGNKYKFSNIFKDFIHERTKLSKLLKNKLYTKAANFLENSLDENLELIVKYHLKSDNKDNIINFITLYAQKSFEYGNLSSLTGIISDLPLEYFDKSFNVLLIYSWGLIKKGELTLSSSLIAKLKPLINSLEDEYEYRLIKANYLYKISRINEYDDLVEKLDLLKNNHFILSRIYLDLGWINLFNGLYLQSDEYFIQSIRNSYLMKKNLYTIAGYLGRSQCLSIRGEFIQAEKLLQICLEKTAKKYCEKDELDLIAYLSLIPIYSEWNDFDKVYSCLRSSASIPKKHKYFLYVNYLILLVNVYISFKDLKNAQKYMLDLEELIMSVKDIPDSFLKIYKALECYFNLVSENEYLSEKWLNTKIIEFNSNKSMDSLEDIEWTTFIYFLIIIDNSKLCLEVCETYLDQAKKINSKRKIIRLLVFRACIKIRKGKWQSALKDIEEALIMGESDNYIRSFSNYSKYILPLLEDINNKVTEEKITYISKNYIEKIINSCQTDFKILVSKKNYELTSREKDVLNLITEKLTNENIGDKLFISTETVKVHVKNILKKLNAASRQEAIIKAKKEKII